MDYASKLEIIKQSMSQLKPLLFQQSVAFFTSKDEDNVFLSSGTLISIEDKLFIATASHSVPDTSENEVWVFHTEPHSTEQPRGPILNKGRNPNDDPDVGFLELGMDTDFNHLKEKACPLERLSTLGGGRLLRPTILVGNPSEYVKPKEHIESGTTGLQPLMVAYLTIPLMESEWPSELNLDPSKDILLDYPDTSGQQLETGQSIMLPNPTGMSGGGIWDQGFEDNVLWTNQSAKLIGIQSGWYEESPRYVRAVQIIHWLRLIYNNYQALQPTLNRHFPKLAANSVNHAG